MQGGAISMGGGSLIIRDCRFGANEAAFGGAIAIFNGSASLEVSKFHLNRCDMLSALLGAAVYVHMNLLGCNGQGWEIWRRNFCTNTGYAHDAEK